MPFSSQFFHIHGVCKSTLESLKIDKVYFELRNIQHRSTIIFFNGAENEYRRFLSNIPTQMQSFVAKIG